MQVLLEQRHVGPVAAEAGKMQCCLTYHEGMASGPPLRSHADGGTVG